MTWLKTQKIQQGCLKTLWSTMLATKTHTTKNWLNMLIDFTQKQTKQSSDSDYQASVNRPLDRKAKIMQISYNSCILCWCSNNNITIWSCLVLRAAGHNFEEQRLVLVQATVFGRIVKDVLSAAGLTPASHSAPDSWRPFHNKLRFIGCTQLNRTVLSVSHVTWRRDDYCDQWRWNVPNL